MRCILVDTCASTFEQTYAHLKRHFDAVHVLSDRDLHCESLVAPTSGAHRLCKQTALWDHLVGAVLPTADVDHVWIVQPSRELPDFSRYDPIDCDLLCKREARGRGWPGWKVCRSIYGGKTRRYPNRPGLFPTMSTVAFRMSGALAARCCENYAAGHTAHRDVFFSSIARKHSLSSQEIELSDIPAAPCIDIVVSCYNTPIHWLIGLVEVLHVHNINRIYVYEKGISYSDCAALATLAGKVSFVRLPNIGRCDHTYLYHITHNWHSLGTYTFFLKDTTFDCGWRTRGGVRKRDVSSKMLKFAKTFRADHTFYCATQPMSNAVKLENYQSVRYTSPFHTYDGDMRRYLASLGVSLPDRYTAVLGGVFGAPRANVRKTDFATYKSIMDTFEHDNCEIGHYVERMWHYMFEVGLKKPQQESVHHVLKVVINSHKSNKIALEHLLQSMSQCDEFQSFCIIVCIGGYHDLDTYDVSEAQNITYIKCNHNSIDFTGLIALAELYSKDTNVYYMYLHDTCKVGRSFFRKLNEIDLQGVTSIRINKRFSMNIGVYCQSVINNFQQFLLQNKFVDSKRAAFAKRESIRLEDHLFKNDKHNIVLGNYDGWQWSGPTDYYNTGTLRIVEYYPNLDLYKIKANWYCKPEFELNL